MKSKKEDKDLKCDQCSRTLYSKRDLNHHKIVKHSKSAEKSKCTYCGKSVHTVSLKKHMKRCDKKF